MKCVASEGQMQGTIIKDKFVLKKHQMLTKYKWRQCTKDENSITGNDNKGTEVGHKNINEKRFFCNV